MTNNRILVLANNLLGLYSFRKEVVEAICNRGYEVIISVPKDEYWFQTHYAFFSQIGCQIIVIDFKRKGTNPFADLELMLTYRGVDLYHQAKCLWRYGL